MAKQVNVPAVIDTQLFLKEDKGQFKASTIFPAIIGLQFGIVLCYVIIIDCTNFYLYRFIPCNAVILKGKDANEQCYNK